MSDVFLSRVSSYATAMFRIVYMIVLVIFGWIAWPLPASAEPDIILTPSSAWNVNYANDSCRLARRFGEGLDESYLIFDRFEPGDPFRMTVIGNAFRRGRNVREATVRFGDGPEQKSGVVRATTNDIPSLIFDSGMRLVPYSDADHEQYRALREAEETYRFQPEPIDPEMIATIETVTITGRRFGTVRFRTGSLQAPFAAFDSCLDELLTHWGIDVERHHNLTRRATPTGSPDRWLVSADYPTDLLRRGAQGLIHFRLGVDPEGNPSDCHIQQSTRPAGFDEIVCRRLMARAHFLPALDADGEPIASYYTNTVYFRAS